MLRKSIILVLACLLLPVGQADPVTWADDLADPTNDDCVEADQPVCSLDEDLNEDPGVTVPPRTDLNDGHSVYINPIDGVAAPADPSGRIGPHSYDHPVWVPAGDDDTYRFWVYAEALPDPTQTRTDGDLPVEPARDTDGKTLFTGASAFAVYDAASVAGLGPQDLSDPRRNLDALWACGIEGEPTCETYVPSPSRLTIPAGEVDAPGPVVFWAFVDVDPSTGPDANGLNSAMGWFSAVKNNMEGYAASDLYDYHATPVVLDDAPVVDGFTTAVRFAGAQTTPGAVVVPADDGTLDVEVLAYHEHHATPEVDWSPYENQQLSLHVVARPGPDAWWDEAAHGATFPLTWDAGSQLYRATVATDALPDGDASLGHQVYVSDALHDDDGTLTRSHYSSFHSIAKDALFTDCFGAPDGEACLARAGFADAIETKDPDSEGRFFTPVVIASEPGVGDGFVAAITPLTALSAEDTTISVTVYHRGSDGAYGATSGDGHNLVLQVDCGGAKPATTVVPVQCAGDDDTTTLTKVYPFTTTGAAVPIDVPAGDLRELLDGLPVTGLHVWVEGAAGHSDYATPTALALQADGGNAARAADLVDHELWQPVVLVGEAPPGDGFVAAYFQDGQPLDFLRPDRDGDITLDVAVMAGDTAAYAPFTGAIQFRVVPRGSDGWYGNDEELGDDVVIQTTPDANGIATVTFNEAQLTQEAADGLPMSYAIYTKMSPAVPTEPSSYHYTGKAEMMSACLDDANDAACSAGAQAADALDVRDPIAGTGFVPLTPVMVWPDIGVAGDDFFTRITPLNSLTTPLGSVMEPTIFGSYFFDVCAFDSKGKAYNFVDYRLELIGPNGAPTDFTAYAVGTYGSIDRAVADNDGDNCVRVSVPEREVGGMVGPDAVYQVAFWTAYAETGKAGYYNEFVNGLFEADGSITAENAAIADEVEETRASGVMLLERGTTGGIP